MSSEENALLINAHGAVVEACMQHLGWDFEVGFATPETAGAGPGSMSRLERWTFTDVGSAEAAGYGFEAYLAEVSAYLERLGENEGEGTAPDPLTMPADEAARYELDYFGTEEERVEIVERDGSRASIPGGGCIGEANEAVWGDIEQHLRLRDARGTAEADIWVATLADRAVADAVNRWKDCMAVDGYEVEDPQQAFEIALTAAQSGDFERERLVAASDASCKAETGLDRAVRAAFLTATDNVLPELEGDLLALQEFEESAVQRARDILRFGE